MTIDEAVKVISLINYKPEHKLVWDAPTNDTKTLRIYWEFKRPDCYNPEEWGVGRSGPVIVYLPDVHTKEQLVRIIFGMTMRLEEHECREFFGYGLERPFDPHKELLQ